MSALDKALSDYHNTDKTITTILQVTGNIKAKKILDKIYESSTEKNRLDRKYRIYKTLC